MTDRSRQKPLPGASEEVRTLSDLQLVTEAALTHLNLDSLLNDLASRIRQIFSADTTAILLLNEDKQTLAVRAAHGLEEEVERRFEIPVGHGVAGQILAERHPMIFNDLNAAEAASPALREKGIRSLIGAPLRVQDHLIGILHVGTLQPRRFTQDDQRLIELIAERVALAIEHARLYEAEWQARANAEAAERRYRALVDGLDRSIVWEADAAAHRFFFVSSPAEMILGYPREAWLDEARFLENHLHPDDRERVQSAFQKLISTGEDQRFDHRIIAEDGRSVWFHTGMSLGRVTPGGQMIHGISMDITNLKEVEAQARAREAQQAAVAELGQRALEGLDLASLMNRAAALVAQALEVEYSKVLELLPEENRLLMRAGIGWREGIVGAASLGAGSDSQAGYTFLSDKPVIVEDLPSEGRFHGPQLLLDHGVISGISVIIPGRTRPFGTLGAHTTRRRRFNEDDVHFLQAIANILANAIDRKEQEEILRRKTTEAEEANRLKSQLVSIVSHELRTPLNAIIGYSALLKEKRFRDDPAKLEEMIERTHENSKTLLDLINRILDVGKMEAGQQAVSPQWETILVSIPLRQTFDSLKPMGEEKGLAMVFIDDPAAPAIRSDAGQIKQIFTNLIGNAIKFTDQGSVTVRIRNRAEEKQVSVEVVDTGIGIPHEDLPYFFEPYYHVAAAPDRSREGTGLGLSIVKRLVEALGGKIEVTSRVGIGTTFTVRLPHLQETPPQGQPE